METIQKLKRTPRLVKPKKNKKVNMKQKIIPEELLRTMKRE